MSDKRRALEELLLGVTKDAKFSKEALKKLTGLIDERIRAVSGNDKNLDNAQKPNGPGNK